MVQSEEDDNEGAVKATMVQWRRRWCSVDEDGAVSSAMLQWRQQRWCSVDEGGAVIMKMMIK